MSKSLACLNNSYQVLEGSEERGRELALPLILGQEKGQGDLLWPLVYVVS